MLFFKNFSILILFITLGGCLPTSIKKANDNKKSVMLQEEAISQEESVAPSLDTSEQPTSGIKKDANVVDENVVDENVVDANDIDEDVVDANSLSRILEFKNCSYVIKHIGFAGVGHSAGSGSSVVFEGKTNVNHFLLKSLGVYDIRPVEKNAGVGTGNIRLNGNKTSVKMNGDVLNVNGEKVTVQREFIVHVPDDYDANFEYAVVFAFHGHGGYAMPWAESLGDLINEYKFIGIYPQGYADGEAKEEDGTKAQTSWNLGTEISTADDIVFVNDIITRLGVISSDASKRFALGSSNGAALSNFLAANAKTKIFSGIGTLVSGLIKTTLEGNTAITIPVSGKTYHYGLSQNSIPLNVVTIFGMSDPIIPYWGGEAKTGTIIYSAEESIREWAKLAGCSDYNSKEVKTFESDSTTIIDLSQYF